MRQISSWNSGSPVLSGETLTERLKFTALFYSLAVRVATVVGAADLHPYFEAPGLVSSQPLLCSEWINRGLS